MLLIGFRVSLQYVIRRDKKPCELTDYETRMRVCLVGAMSDSGHEGAIV